MTETSQQYHRPLKPLGMKGDILPRDASRFSTLSGEPPPVLPEGLKGYLAENPDFGKKDGNYHTLLHFSTHPADALPPLPEERQQTLRES